MTKDRRSPPEQFRYLMSGTEDARSKHQNLPCPICGGVEGCDHTVPERARAARGVPLQWRDCPACEGSGVIAHRVTVYEHGCGFPHDDTDERPCGLCGGDGRIAEEERD